MGTFLLLFVPQNCEGQTCTMLELWQPVQTEYQMALYFNTLTLAMFLWTYMWELKRERWCIQHLDNNNHADRWIWGRHPGRSIQRPRPSL